MIVDWYPLLMLFGIVDSIHPHVASQTKRMIRATTDVDDVALSLGVVEAPIQYSVHPYTSRRTVHVDVASLRVH